MKKQLIILGIALSLLTSACYFESNYLGNKNVVQRSKETAAFQAIELRGSIRNLKLYFSQDSAAPFIRVEVDSNILDKVAI
ncbi:MAG: hypothetical protein LBL18_06275, partial [Bacteroidales bacterium]|nr:hypothetical protein [Bacteroidales bacterium]